MWQHLSGNGWSWFQAFVTDVHLYSGRLQELAYRTEAATAPGGGAGARCCRALLQRLTAAFGTGDYQVRGWDSGDYQVRGWDSGDYKARGWVFGDYQVRGWDSGDYQVRG